MKIIHDLSLSELKSELEQIVEKMPRYRAGQIFSWMNDYTPFDDMSNIPTNIREKLKSEYIDQCVKIEKELISVDGTRKYLFSLYDGNIVEGVLMSYKYGNTICISTQCGCRMGCAFCATGIDGLARNLTPGEMLSEILAVNRHIGGTKADRKITNVVLMGCGEPLDNYDNVVKFIKLVSDKEGFNLSQRNISLSTCGIAPNIKRLADENLGITLTISLHSTTDEMRKNIMKVARAYSLDELFDSIKYYFDKTKRRIVFEYIELDCNTSREDAERIKSLCRGISYHMNLIPVNSTPHTVEENPYLKPADKQKSAMFWEELKKLGISATTRRTLGSDISGACGQLRRSVTNKIKNHNSGEIMVSPSILAIDYNNEVVLKKALEDIENGGAELVHIDIMDGKFVPATTFDHNLVKKISSMTKLTLDVHLMVENPESVVDDYINAGADIVTIHYESCDNVKEVLEKIRSRGIPAGIAISPETDAEKIADIVSGEIVSMVTVMTVKPGAGGQKFMSEMTEKITKIKAMNKNVIVEVDGGVNTENAGMLKELGTDILVSGSCIFKSDDIKKTINTLKGNS